MDIAQISTITNGFIPDARCQRFASPRAVRVTGRFAAEHYTPALYAMLDMRKPPGFANMASKRQADFLAGRIFARLAMVSLGVDWVDLPIAASRAPVWPFGLTGAISHSHGQACCLITDVADIACGIDIEQVASGPALEAVLQRCLTPQDLHWISAEADLPADVAATLLFSAKESIFKAYHPTVGRFFGFEAAQVKARLNADVILFELVEDLQTGLHKGYEIPLCFRLQDDAVLTWLLHPLPKT